MKERKIGFTFWAETQKVREMLKEAAMKMFDEEDFKKSHLAAYGKEFDIKNVIRSTNGKSGRIRKRFRSYGK